MPDTLFAAKDVAMHSRCLLAMIVGCVWIAACGRMPLAPTCPPIAANFVRTDTLYWAQVKATPPHANGPPVIAFLVDIYACGGADVGQKKRAP